VGKGVWFILEIVEATSAGEVGREPATGVEPIALGPANQGSLTAKD
jgi:hypothetical protein